MNFLQLPPEILVEIGKFCGSSVISLSMTCKKLNTLLRREVKEVIKEVDGDIINYIDAHKFVKGDIKIMVKGTTEHLKRIIKDRYNYIPTDLELKFIRPRINIEFTLILPLNIEINFIDDKPLMFTINTYKNEKGFLEFFWMVYSIVTTKDLLNDNEDEKKTYQKIN
jgi:hypothetical protein